MVKKKFLILIFFIFLIYLNYTYAEGECIFDKYIKIEGDGICFINCSERVVYSKELHDIYVTPLKSDVIIRFRPVEGSTEEPSYEFRKNESSLLHIIKPPIKNFGYYYWIITPNQTLDSFKIRVLSYEYYNLCEQKPKPPSQSTNPPLLSCTFKDWECSEWYQKECPENEKQTRSCKLKNPQCLNPEIVKPFTNQNCKYVPPIELQPPNIPNKWSNLLSSLSKNWWWISFILLVIIGILYARKKWKTPIGASLKGITKKATENFEKAILKIGIPKSKKSRSKK